MIAVGGQFFFALLLFTTRAHLPFLRVLAEFASAGVHRLLCSPVTANELARREA
jgi:hypothetical protein